VEAPSVTGHGALFCPRRLLLGVHWSVLPEAPEWMVHGVMGVMGYGVLAEVPDAGDAQSTSVCQYLCDQVPMHCSAGGNVL
jgi:hypothetical protein